MSGDQEPHTNGLNGDASDDEVTHIMINLSWGQAQAKSDPASDLIDSNLWTPSSFVIGAKLPSVYYKVNCIARMTRRRWGRWTLRLMSRRWRGGRGWRPSWTASCSGRSWREWWETLSENPDLTPLPAWSVMSWTSRLEVSGNQYPQVVD